MAHLQPGAMLHCFKTEGKWSGKDFSNGEPSDEVYSDVYAECRVLDGLLDYGQAGNYEGRHVIFECNDVPLDQSRYGKGCMRLEGGLILME